MLSPDHRQHASRVIEEPKNRTGWYFLVAIVAGVTVWGLQQQPAWGPPVQKTASPDGERAFPPAAASQTVEREGGAHSAKGDLRTLFSADDYPAAAARLGEQGTVQVELAVNESGKVTHCTIIQSSGHPSLDNATCVILQRRARFIPAQDVDGRSVPDRVTTPPITWRLEG